MLTKMDVFRGLADNWGDMGFSEAEWESMFQLMDANYDDNINFQSYVNGVAAYQLGSNQTKIRETFHLIDVRGEGEFTLSQLQQVLQEEF